MAPPAPAVVLSFGPLGPQFPISDECQMPVIKATATLQNIQADPKAPPMYSWTASLVFKGSAACPHSLSIQTAHDEMKSAGLANTFALPLTQIRGGDLTISVTVTIGGQSLTATSEKLQVTGTNPSIAALSKVQMPGDAFKKLMRVESGLKQFQGPACPLFSGDNLGGVGICQITSPTPTPDQIWSWKENLKAGIALYRSKEAAARAYPGKARQSSEFKALVKDYNDKRVAKSKPEAPLKALTIDLPDFTADQLERDTVRGFNGYAAGLHEYRVKVDKDGVLVVTVDPGGTKGAAEWEAMTAADRIAEYDKKNITANHRGDPNYVEDVYKKASF